MANNNELSIAQKNALMHSILRQWLILICIAVILLWIISGYNRSISSDNGQLANRINPNTANWSQLALLPGIGPQTSQKIIAYRQSRKRADSNGIAFECINDLQKVKSIGPKTAMKCKEYLIFDNK